MSLNLNASPSITDKDKLFDVSVLKSPDCGIHFAELAAPIIRGARRHGARVSYANAIQFLAAPSSLYFSLLASKLCSVIVAEQVAKQSSPETEISTARPLFRGGRKLRPAGSDQSAAAEIQASGKGKMVLGRTGNY